MSFFIAEEAMHLRSGFRGRVIERTIYADSKRPATVVLQAQPDDDGQVILLTISENRLVKI